MKARKANFVFLEMLAALAVLALLTACFIASLRTLMDVDRAFGAETRAILTLDNVLERAGALKQPSSKDFQRLFQCEYSKSPLAGSGKLKASFEYSGGLAKMRILKDNGKPLAEVKVKCKE